MPIPALVSQLRRAALGLALVAAWALPACTQGADGGADAGSQQSSLQSCSTDAECQADGHRFVCDRLRRTCVCTRDAMCAGSLDGPFCNAFTGRCVSDIAGCKGDSECAAGQFCDQALRTCRQKKGYCQGCTQDEECGGTDDHCVHHPNFPSLAPFCATACGDNDLCPQGQACLATERGKQCVPAAGRCKNDACIPDSGQVCASDADCTQGLNQVCDRVLGRCMAADRTCALGQSCDPITQQCVQGCSFDKECVDRYRDPTYTCIHNTCVRASACKQDTDCLPAQWCLKEPGKGDNDFGTCQNACSADIECPLGQRCLNNPLTNRRRCTEGCVNGQNETCPLNAICTEGQCEFASGGLRRCQVKQVCEFRENCQNNSCIAAPNNCKQCTAQFDATGVCAELGFNFQCTDTTCPTGFAKRCYAMDMCGGARGCYCSMQRWLVRAASDTQCPKGFDLQTIQVVNPSTSRLEAVQVCYPVAPELCR